jgi:phosphoribosylaminoimidazole synthetase
VLPLLGVQVAGDVLLGLPSSGVHSNGFSLVRRICAAYGADMLGPPPYPSPHRRLVDDLLTPTKIYIRALLPALKLPGPPRVKAMAHITGGGLPDNLPRGIAPGLGARLDATAWPMLPVFKWMKNVGGGVEASEMARTFNCSLGMVLVVGAEHADAVAAAIQGAGEQVYVVGRLEKRGDGPCVVIDNLEKAFA